LRFGAESSQYKHPIVCVQTSPYEKLAEPSCRQQTSNSRVVREVTGAMINMICLSMRRNVKSIYIKQILHGAVLHIRYPFSSSFPVSASKEISFSTIPFALFVRILYFPPPQRSLIVTYLVRPRLSIAEILLIVSSRCFSNPC